MTTKRYYELLPRKLKNKTRCQVLGMGGNRCKNHAIAEVQAHLDAELYTDGVAWIVFNVCQEHLDMESLLKS